MPTACEEVERKVRQVRICIEVLRRYLKAQALPAGGTSEETALEKGQQAYLEAAYTALLTRVGASFEELRLAETADPAERETLRKALADRLGIPPDTLERLLLDPTAASAGLEPLTEGSLDEVFGLVDTRLERNPLSDGATRGDAQGQIDQWNLDGVLWNRHTDEDGTIHVRLTGAPAGNVVTVELFRDQNRTELVAAGERPMGGSAPIVLVAEDGSDLTGRFRIDGFITATDTIEIVAVPHYLSWRLQYLRARWLEEDWPEDPYAEGAAAPLPIIDPDVIGPDDLRQPVAGSAAFAVWLKRRDWVDAQLDELAGLEKTVTDAEGNSVKVPDVGALFDRMYQPVTNEALQATPWATTTPPGAFSTLRDDLAQGKQGRDRGGGGAAREGAAPEGGRVHRARGDS